MQTFDNSINDFISPDTQNIFIQTDLKSKARQCQYSLLATRTSSNQGLVKHFKTTRFWAIIKAIIKIVAVVASIVMEVMEYVSNVTFLVYFSFLLVHDKYT